MRWLSGFFIVALLANDAVAQAVMDGSEKGVPTEDLQGLRKSLQNVLFDPYGSQLAELRKTEKGMCGIVNAKNQMGGFLGFRAFGYDKAADKVIINEPVEPALADLSHLSGSQLLEAHARAQRRLEALEAIVEICPEQ